MLWGILCLLWLRVGASALTDPVLVWADDFLGSEIDGDKWSYDEGDGCDYNICGWGNDELQWYRRENVAVSDGKLALSLRKENYASKAYTSGKIITRRKAAFKYGRIEAKMKAPQPADGLWPALWMLPASNTYGVWAASGEIDIFESKGDMAAVINNLVFNASYPNQAQAFDFDGGKCEWKADLSSDYHVYALEWTPEEFKWYMDDELICNKTTWFAVDSLTGKSLAKPAPFDQEFYLILNLAVGGTLGGKKVGHVDNSVLMVDYIRVYQEREIAAPPASFYTLEPLGSGADGGELVWQDEFSGSKLNSDRWTAASGDACEGDKQLCSAELQTYAVANAKVKGGMLSLEVSSSGSGGKTKYSSAMVTTGGSFGQEYGRFEARVRLPGDSGLVPAMWLLPEESGASYGQVDVFAGPDGATIAGVRYGSISKPTVISCDAPSPLLAADNGFHVWAVEWNAARLRWYADGQPFCERARPSAGSWPFTGNYSIGLGVAVGRDAAGASVDSEELGALQLPVAMEVDYVRVYQARDVMPVEESEYITKGYKIWWDEFEGSGLDGRLWRGEFGDGCDTTAGCGNGNREAQFYRPENAAVSTGDLVLTAKHETYGGNIFTSAKLTTLGLQDFLRGRFEARIKLPKGQGLWPAFWMMPSDNKYGNWSASGEIDIMENRNYMEKSLGQLHFGGTYPKNDDLLLYQGGGLCYSDQETDFSADYHVYAIEWEESRFRWFVDGRLFCERTYWYAADAHGKHYPFPAPFDQKFYLVLTLAVGGVFTGGPIDLSILPAEMRVDYVRIYSMDPDDIIMTEPKQTFNVMTLAIALGVVGAAVVLCGASVAQRFRRAKRAKAAEAAGFGAGGGVVKKQQHVVPPEGVVSVVETPFRHGVPGSDGGGQIDSAAPTPPMVEETSEEREWGTRVGI